MASMLWIHIDRSLHIPLTKQVYEQLRTKILTRELRAGAKLPPTRKLAQELNISRNVILYVYEQLAAEGYLESREGSGTYIAQGTYLEQYKDYYSYALHSDYSRKADQQDHDLIDFNTGVPDFRHFPRKIWAKLLREACLDVPESVFDYGKPEGIFELRLSLSKFLLRTKGIRCHPDQIVILSGSAQGFFIIANLLAPPYHEVIIEDIAPIPDGECFADSTPRETHRIRAQDQNVYCRE
jgi:GntR family transcriptional regulator/MocR family aminotransferase